MKTEMFDMKKEAEKMKLLHDQEKIHLDRLVKDSHHNLEMAKRSLEHEKALLQDALDQSEFKARKLADETALREADLHRRIESATAEQRRLEGALAEKSAAIEQLQAELVNYQSRSQMDSRSLQEQMNSVNSDRQSILAQLESTRQKVAILQEKVLLLESERTNVLIEKEKLSGQFEALQSRTLNDFMWSDILTTCESLYSSRTLPELAQSLQDKLTPLLSASSVALYLLQEPEGLVRVVSSRPAVDLLQHNYFVGEGMVGKVISDVGPAVLRLSSADPSSASSLLDSGIRNCLSVVLRVGGSYGTPIGVFVAIDKAASVDGFSISDEALIRSLAPHIGLSLDLVRTLQSAQQDRASLELMVESLSSRESGLTESVMRKEDELSQKEARLLERIAESEAMCRSLFEALKSVGGTISQLTHCSSLGLLFDLVSIQVKKACQAESCRLFVVYRDRDLLLTRSETGADIFMPLSSAPSSQHRIAGADLVRQCALSSEVATRHSTPQSLHDVGFSNLETVSDITCVPIFDSSSRTVLGVLQVFSRVSSHSLVITESIASVISIPLQQVAPSVPHGSLVTSTARSLSPTRSSRAAAAPSRGNEAPSSVDEGSLTSLRKNFTRTLAHAESLEEMSVISQQYVPLFLSNVLTCELRFLNAEERHGRGIGDSMEHKAFSTLKAVQDIHHPAGCVLVTPLKQDKPESVIGMLRIVRSSTEPFTSQEQKIAKQICKDISFTFSKISSRFQKYAPNAALLSTIDDLEKKLSSVADRMDRRSRNSSPVKSGTSRGSLSRPLSPDRQTHGVVRSVSPTRVRFAD
eukprot:GILI01022608.1.p1 GENE.GILI01022608.1~~GILI01022608.1.p1  ORF type:complete len:848 (-),score=145.51 GILI01022608.1:174-2606(-)